MNSPMHSNRSIRGEAVTLVLLFLAGMTMGIFGAKWSPFLIFKPKPPTAQLTKLQDDLAKANDAAEKARLAREAAIIAERQKLDAEVKAAQEDNTGTLAALAKVATEHRTAEIKLAQSMANRVSIKLIAAVGELPRGQQDAMIALIDQALSDKQAEVDAANAKFAARDADFKALAVERDQIKAQIPVLTAKAVKAEETAATTQTLVNAKTNEVKKIANDLDAKERENGSLGGALESALSGLRWIIVIAVVLLVAVLYLRYGLGSVGRALHPLSKILSPSDYGKVITTLDGETDKLHQWLISSGRKAEAFINPNPIPPPT